MAGEERKRALGRAAYVRNPSTGSLLDPLFLSYSRRSRPRYLAIRPEIHVPSSTILSCHCCQVGKSVSKASLKDAAPYTELESGRCFHLDDVGHLPEQWSSLCSYLTKNTKGECMPGGMMCHMAMLTASANSRQPVRSQVESFNACQGR
jgi:hypothetical protein